MSAGRLRRRASSRAAPTGRDPFCSTHRTPTTLNSDRHFGLDPILAAITEMGYATPTPIQAKAIPVVMKVST